MVSLSNIVKPNSFALLLIIETFSSPWSVMSLYGLGCNIVLQLCDLAKDVNGGAVILLVHSAQK